jgi:hypothetical protein
MSYEHPQHLNLKLPVITLKAFDSKDFSDWAYKAQRFFSQYGLWDIVTGKRKNPAGDVTHSHITSIIDLGEGAGPRPDGRILVGKPDPNQPHEVSVYEWNYQHNLAYNYLMNALENDNVAYRRCASAKDVVGVWETLRTQYGPDDDEFEPEVELTGQKVFRRTLRIHVKWAGFQRLVRKAMREEKVVVGGWMDTIQHEEEKGNGVVSEL